MRSATRRGLSALAALALVAGSLLAAVPAQAATPVSPADAAYFEGESVTLTWNADATSNGLYLVRWWTLGAGIQSRQVSGTTTQLDNLADGTYYWSVAHYTYSPVFGHRPTLINTTRTFTVEAAPLVSLSPLPGTIGPEGSLVVIGSAKDSAFAWADLYLDGELWGRLSTTALGPLHLFAQTLNFAGTPLIPGEHILRVDAEDVGGRPDSATATFWVDGSGPTAAIVSPANGGYVKGGGADVPVSMSFSELSTWSLWADGNAAGGGLGLNPSVDVDVDPSIWADGTEHTFAVDATDLYGNASASPPITVTVDGIAPEIELTRPVLGTPLVVGNSLLARGTATDARSGVDSVTVAILSSEPGDPCSVLETTGTATRSGGTWSATVDTSALAEGPYCVEAEAKDAVGLSGYSSIGHIVVDHGAPGLVTLHAPLDGSIVTSKNVTLGWNAPTGPPETLKYEYELGKSSTLLGNGSLSGATAATGIGALTSLVKNLANGTYHWHARALDEAGNPGPWSEVWSLKIAVPAPPAPPKVTTTTTDPVDPTPTPEVTEPTDPPTDEETEEPEETDEPAAPTDEPEASGDSADAGFPAWVAIGIIVLVLAGLAFFIRFFFFRRA